MAIIKQGGVADGEARTPRGRPGVETMSERTKTCILCGAKEVMEGFICAGCQDRIQREVMMDRNQQRDEAQGALDRAVAGFENSLWKKSE